jgi:hypothetical protein
MLAVHTMSAGTEAVLYFIALVAFVVAAIFAFVTAPRAIWAILVASGLALFALVLFWNSAALA